MLVVLSALLLVQAVKVVLAVHLCMFIRLCSPPPPCNCASGHTGKFIHSLKLSSVLRTSASQAVLSCDAAHRLCDSPKTSRPFALGASNVCLVGEIPVCSVPALQGYEGLWSHDYGHA